MPWLLRRVGGLRRLLLGLCACVLGLYLFHAYFLSDDKLPIHGSGNHDLKSVTAPFPRFIQPTTGQNDSEPTIDEDGCNEAVKCPKGAVFYTLSSTLDEGQKPLACVDGKRLFDPAKLVKGANMLVISEKDFTVKEPIYFDLSSAESGRKLIDTLIGVERSEIIMLSLWGDVAEKLTSDVRELLGKFGSQQISQYKQGSSFVLVGQKGLSSGHAIEKVREGTANVQLQGCLKFPLGPTDPNVQLNGPDSQSPLPPVLIGMREPVVYGAAIPNCGMRDPCPGDAIPVSVYSGKHKDDEPKICVDGRYLMSRSLNGGGRGLNVVVLNGTSRGVERLGHFDTYSEDSSALEIFLEQMLDDEILIVVSFDEASNRLSNMGKQMFYELGSGLIQNLKFRASWYFVGQKGLSGFTPFEELNFATGNEWAKPVDQRLCIPPKLTVDGRKVRPDPSLHSRNDARRHFCDKYDGYEEFCDGEHVDEALTAAPLFDRSMENDPIFKVPILVVAGLSHNSLRLSLETLLRQSGINPKMVLVTYDENYEESKGLASLFGFRAFPLSAPVSYMSQMVRSMELAWKEFQNAEALIVLEEELVVTADFLLFMAQLLPLLLKDPTLLSVSAWNDNGFVEVSSVPNVVYREEIFPGLGFMLKRSVYQELIGGKEEACCMRRAWDGWNFDTKHHSLVPDVSRVFRRHSDGLGLFEQRLEDLFHRERAYSEEGETRLLKVESLSEANYDKEVAYLIRTGRPLAEVSVSACLGSGGKNTPKLPKANNPKETFVLFVKESNENSTELVWKLAQCFGLYHSEGQSLRGFYKGILRFSVHSRPIIIVTEKSPFFASKPPTVRPIQLTSRS